jgi:hypothetical protein
MPELSGVDLGNVSFVLQIIILALILVGSYNSRAKRRARHGWIMTLAIVLHTISIFVIMIPSILGSVDLLGELSSGGITTWMHMVSGTIAEIWGIALIAMWGFAKPKMTCAARTWQMRLLLIVWVLALASGIIVHLLYI